MEVSDDEIGKKEYDIKDIYQFWKKGKDIWENKEDYIKEANKLVFFEDFYKTFFKDNKLKIKILNKINKIFQVFINVRKYIIFKEKICLLCDENQNIDIIEKNYLSFNEIDFFQGIIDDEGFNFNEIKKMKGTMKYENGDLYIGKIKDGKREGKGIMIYKNGEIFDGYWENDIQKEYISKYDNSKLFKYYEQSYLGEKNKINLNKSNLNDEEFNDYLKKIDINTQNCQIHKYLIIGLCIDEDCKEKNKLLCQKCLFKEHKKHDIIEIEEYNNILKEKLINRKQYISEIKELQKNKKYLDKELDFKITELKKNINSLIDQKIESYISSIFEIIQKENEKFLNQNIDKLKENYPIDNLNKQVGITNLIFSLKDIKFNNKIENINDIFDIKIKNIKNEMEEIISAIFNNKGSNLYEIDNPWENELINPNDKVKNDELEENNKNKENDQKKIDNKEKKEELSNIDFPSKKGDKKEKKNNKDETESSLEKDGDINKNEVDSDFNGDSNSNFIGDSDSDSFDVIKDKKNEEEKIEKSIESNGKKNTKKIYKKEENINLKRKKNGIIKIIKSKLKLKEGNTYIILFNIIKSDKSHLEIGFGNIELLQSEKYLSKKGGICLSNQGLFIDGIKTSDKIVIENNDEICFILVLKKDKFFILFKNGKYFGKFNFNLTNIYALASIQKTGDSVKLKTFIEL